MECPSASLDGALAMRIHRICFSAQSTFDDSVGDLQFRWRRDILASSLVLLMLFESGFGVASEP